MYKKLRVAIAQAEAVKADPAANRDKLIAWVKEAALKGADMVVFPELFYSAYDISKEALMKCAIDQKDVFFEQIRDLAIENDINILFSYPEIGEGKDKPYISVAFIDSAGNCVSNHRKTYLWGEEANKAERGELVYEPVKTSFGTIGTLICYEIEFPEPARILTLKGAEIIIVTAAFDTIPNFHKYLSAIGILNQVYVIGVNGWKSDCAPARGGSCIVDQRGKVIFELPITSEKLGIFDIDLGTGNRRDEAPHKEDLIIDTLRQLSKIERWK